MTAEPSLLPIDPLESAVPAVTGERASLYRAYRSLTFAEVAGQQHVTQTLLNAVRYGKVAHAYLFTGPRGTGKTSTARILARAVNCLQPHDGEPCNACSVCLGMLERRSLDLVEIDGASNNSVDDVRELRERVNFRPAEARRKVFIIDEVHMLSIGAFNALLKTLEEPPDHVLFALATTEIHKVPATVVSRCQRFDLRPIPVGEMVERLRFVCAHESIQAEDSVIGFLATQSTGSLRDALSLLEQIRAYCGDVLRLAEVEAALGVARITQVASLADAMAAGDLAGALLLVGELTDSGIDPRQLARQLTGYWRDALLGRARRQLVAEQHVARCSAEQIVPVLRSLMGVETTTRRSDSPRWALELAIADATLALAGAALVSGAQPAPPRSVAPVQPTASAVSAPQVQDARASTDLAGQVIQPKEEQRQAAPLAERDTQAPAEPSEAAGEIGTHSDGKVPNAGEPEAVVSTEEARNRWPRVMHWLSEHNKTNIRSYLQPVTAAGVDVDGSVLVIGFPAASSFFRGQLERAMNRQVLEQAVSDVFGGRWTVRCVTIESLAPPPRADGDELDYLEDIAAEASGRGRREHDKGV